MSSGKGGGGGADAGPMLQYGQKALDLQKEIYDQQRSDAQPWYKTGSGAVNQLAMLMGINTGPSAQSRQSLIDQYKPQFTTTTQQSSPYVGIPQSLLRDRMMNPGEGFSDMISGIRNAPQTQSVTSTDMDGLNAYIDSLLSNAEDPSTNPLFGSLAKNFGMDDYQADPGYQFRLAEGNKALERKLNASGKTYSPEAAKALLGYGQGLASEEYGNAYNRFNNDQGNLFNRLATLSGFGQTATGQVANAGTNYANSAGDLYTGMGNAITSSNLANQANRGSMFNSLLGAGAQLGSAWMFSDERLKENIIPMGDKNGYPVYQFNYIGDDTQYIGVMAQDVEKINHDAVQDVDGYLAVNYDALGFQMEEVQ